MPFELKVHQPCTEIVERVQTLSVESVNQWYETIRNDALEMARLKSGFDVKYFTVESVGPFPAHQFHMLMRQQSLAMLELKRLLIDRESLSRDIYQYENSREEERIGFYPDLEIEKAKNEIDSLELSIRNKLAMVEAFEGFRQKLIKEHGDEQFTDEEYQNEEPLYWKWKFQKMVNHYQLQNATGVPEGLWNNIDMAGEQSMIPIAHVPEPLRVTK